MEPEFWKTTHNRGFGFQAEALRRLLDEQCLAAGVVIRFYTRVVEVDSANQQVKGVVAYNIEGLTYIPAKMVIDATGDAMIADLCGVSCIEAGRNTNNIMPPTLCSIVGDIDYNRFDRRTMQAAAVEKALEDGFFSQPDRQVPGLFQTGQSTAILNAGHLFKITSIP